MDHSPGQAQQVAKSLGFDPATQLQDLLVDNLGICGCAHALIMLAAALEQSNAGDRILMASYGDGSDALLFQVTEAIGKLKNSRHTLDNLLSSKECCQAMKDTSVIVDYWNHNPANHFAFSPLQPLAGVNVIQPFAFMVANATIAGW